MPKHKQVTVEAPVTERFMGRSDTNQNKACFGKPQNKHHFYLDDLMIPYNSYILVCLDESIF